MPAKLGEDRIGLDKPALRFGPLTLRLIVRVQRLPKRGSRRPDQEIRTTRIQPDLAKHLAQPVRRAVPLRLKGGDLASGVRQLEQQPGPLLIEERNLVSSLAEVESESCDLLLKEADALPGERQLIFKGAIGE